MVCGNARCGALECHECECACEIQRVDCSQGQTPVAALVFFYELYDASCLEVRSGSAVPPVHHRA